MSMHSSEELKDVVKVIFDQLAQLDIKAEHAGIVVDYKPREDWHFWVADDQEIPSKITVPYLDLVWDRQFTEAKKEGKDFFTTHLNFEEKNSFYKTLLSHVEDVTEEARNFYFTCPGLAISTVIEADIGLYIENFSGTPFSDEENDILKRFGKVFQQAYTRFLDLRKAEEQAREAQIETSLEKVRAQAMGMQNSEDLSNVASVMFDEMKRLGGELFAFGIVLCDKGKDTVEQWHNLGNEGMISSFTVPVDLDYIHRYRYNQWLAGEELFSIEIPSDYITEHFELMFALPSVEAAMDEVADQGIDVQIPEWEIDYGASFTYGYLLVSSRKPFEETHIFPRFAKVFDQAYTRYLDLKRAEKQAREAQIEAALERVRSRSMGMQKGEELQEVAVLLYKELIALGVTNFVTCGYVEVREDINRQYTWITAPDGDTMGLFYLPLTGDATFNERYAAWKNQQKIFHQTVAGKVRSDHLEFAITTFNSKEAEEMTRSQFPDPTVFYCFNFSHGYLHLVTGSLLEKDEELLLTRFTKVFEQTYTRFLDLKKAEKQAAEAIKQASLDRVRGEIASMRSTEDLENITPLIWNELKTLGVPFIRCGVFIIHEDEKQIEAYLSKPDGTSLAVMHLSFDSNNLTAETVKAWQNREISTHHWSHKEFLDFGKGLLDQGKISDLKSYQGAEKPPESLYLHFIPFNQGMLYVGSTDLLDEEEISLSESLANTFSIAYARYEDFVKLEKAKAVIENALDELKATQEQLVQQEKLASLGQLTAGIAHEIKNPLNFVNNFSDLSVELIQEARDEIKTVETYHDTSLPEDALEEVSAILDSVETNLRKIHEHGSRADGIVKSM
ncbi:MAG: histidine kinase dimerization/phospho-acceptor domain-containing protein, partial [Balneolaceae bacterium]|nr:histidine kinase dimerization/phospho-acceptor domain-containing protein [Balneolaceae bacterium]